MTQTCHVAFLRCSKPSRLPATRIQRQLQAACTRKASKAVPSRGG
ncbi:hypothetical protein SS05631_a45730 (plasmid) [Sinorhizobium sp. CCBAU 05631]|nr:hypothetical protein SS05631_a45730 [Sinorhizobium sp. CCBAU 05631]ASY74009.1 hypothetical protein SF83666_a44210 [Sinorhizobium fredii CCBAU 83666]